MRTVLSGILTELDFEVSTAKHGLDALEQLKDGLQPDIMLLDLHMPVMTGLELLALLPPRGAMRVVMVTGEDDPCMKSWALQYGVDAYIHRPFNAAAVVDTLVHLGLAQPLQFESLCA